MKQHRKANIASLLLMLGVLFAAPSYSFVTASEPQAVNAELAPVYTDVFGRAIGGYDPVAYFTEGEAVYGDKNITYRWRGADWQFVSLAHRDAFIADPERYAPQYGGYCAYAVSHGVALAVDPEAFTVHDGKLYLNKYRVLTEWRAHRERLIEIADRHWQRTFPLAQLSN